MRRGPPIHRTLLLLKHSWTLVRGRVLRWRLETFGLYAPSYPHERPWWRVNLQALALLLQHRHAYAAWLLEMQTLRKHGPPAWWRDRLDGHYNAFAAYVRQQNQPEEVSTEHPDELR